MNEIALHIDFLLHSHDCVIIPGLGGFVVNTKDVDKNGLWGLDAPTFELIFNNKLRYNDGLLAESLMKANKVSYKVAIKEIESACEELKNRLMKSEKVEWDKLGTFKTDNENNIILLPNKNYVRPQFYGLTNARFKPTALALSSTRNDNNAIPVKSAMRYVSTAIAAAVVLFFVVVSFNNISSPSHYAEIVSKPLIFGSSSHNTKVVKQTQPIAVVAKESFPATTMGSSTIAKPQYSGKTYYIIVGVYEVRDVAEKSLSRLKSQGFQAASMIERPRRLDVYSASFSNRGEAHTFLHKFQADNPQYNDAWILKR